MLCTLNTIFRIDSYFYPTAWVYPLCCQCHKILENRYSFRINTSITSYRYRRYFVHRAYEKEETVSLPLTLSGACRVIGGRRRASIVLPEPGTPTINRLCSPAAAISNARLAKNCPCTSAKASNSASLPEGTLTQLAQILRYIHTDSVNEQCLTVVARRDENFLRPCFFFAIHQI